MIDVYCFSGGGHSEEVAVCCAARLGGQVIPVGAETSCEGERALFVFPVYCERLPPPVAGFLRRAKVKQAAFVATYGGMSFGHVLYDAQRLFAGSVLAGAYVPTEHSFIRDGFRFDDGALIPVLEKLSSGGREVIFPRTPGHIFSGFAPAWRSRVGVRLIRKDSCDGCNICAQACPMRAMDKGRANGACIRCLRCVRICPRGALSVRLSAVVKRYLSRRRRNDTVVYI